MDRFKFRVWDKEDKKFLDHLCINLSADGILILWRLEGKKYINLNDNNRYLLMQCTGLKDKNGNLIYEGDIVKGEKKNPYSSLYKDYVNYYEAEVKWIKDGFYLDSNIYDYTIIRNIHENKKLLEANNG